mmetsp:Transcript_6978/g.17099  ORF Transcript_6978/g.17099 Transcript_6978/m.17099 type:complete len:213 (+) Transcript_6978:156-794(+)
MPPRRRTRSQPKESLPADEVDDFLEKREVIKMRAAGGALPVNRYESESDGDDDGSPAMRPVMDIDEEESSDEEENEGEVMSGSDEEEDGDEKAGWGNRKKVRLRHFLFPFPHSRAHPLTFSRLFMGQIMSIMSSWTLKRRRKRCVMRRRRPSKFKSANAKTCSPPTSWLSKTTENQKTTTQPRHRKKSRTKRLKPGGRWLALRIIMTKTSLC